MDTSVLSREATATQQAALPSRSAPAVTTRAVALGVVGTILCVYWNVYGEVVSQTDLTSTSLMMPPICLLLVLIIGSGALGHFWPRLRLAQGEMLVAYAMMTVGVVVTGMGGTQFLFTTLGAVPHYANATNQWEQFLPFIPPYLLPQPNPKAQFDGFYMGQASIPWSAWLVPLAVWGVFFFTLVFAMYCMNVLVRKQWADRERLSFPIVFLPMEMTSPGAGFFRNRLMWMGFALAFALESLNSLNALFPTVPYLQLRAFDLGPSFVSAPFNAVGYFPTTFYPLAVGLGFLLPLDLSFSLWFFYLFTKAESIFGAATGITDAGGLAQDFPFLGHQAAGSWIAIIGLTALIGRKHYWEVIKKALGRPSTVDDADEPLSYRAALFGLLASIILILAFWMHAGMAPMVAVVFLAGYLAFAVAISRMRAEAGPAWIMGPGFDARDMSLAASGQSGLGMQNLTSLAIFGWFNAELRCMPSPTHLEAFKMAEAAKTKQRALSWALLLALAVGILAGFYFCLQVWYAFGADSAKVEPWRTSMGRNPFDRAMGTLNNPKRMTSLEGGALLVGVAVTVVLSLIRLRFVEFPFHPVGYALANTGTMYWLWCPFLIAWMVKVVLTRYGGVKAYRQAMPFFLGLVLGDYVTSSLWSLAGSLLHIQMYRCFPC
ncbi:MAG TPA: DUF6785 family protein [Armatimonadota bacterium]